MTDAEFIDAFHLVNAADWHPEDRERLRSIANELRVLAEVKEAASAVISCDSTCALGSIIAALAKLEVSQV